MKPFLENLKNSLLSVKTEIETAENKQEKERLIRDRERLNEDFNASRSFGAFGPSSQNSFTNSRSRNRY